MSDMGPPRRRRSGDGSPRRRSRPRYEDEYDDDRYEDDRYEDDRPYREPRRKKNGGSTSPAATVLIIGGVLAAIGIVVCAGAILYTFAGRFTDPGGGVNPELEEARMQEAMRSGQ